MTNLFAALGWTLCLALLDPDAPARIAGGDRSPGSSIGARSKPFASGNGRS